MNMEETKEEEVDTKMKKIARGEEGIEFNPENEDNIPPPYIIVDGRVIEVPPKLKEIRIKRCKKWTLPIMTFMPVSNEKIPNSRL